MEWIQTITLIVSLILGNAALVVALWIAQRHDLKNIESKQEVAIRENAKEMRDLVEANSKENRSLISAFQEAIRLEMKDFHGRLCAIEEKYRSKK